MRAAIERGVIGLGFAISTIGILVWNRQSLDHLAIALALICLCVDQGRMALIDLSNIRQITLSDGRVNQFLGVTLITITIELVGFYLAWQWLAAGTVVVLGSQLFFNTAAKIQLYPNSLEPIQPMGLKERSPVLMANTVALGLVSLWQAGLFCQLTSALLLLMVLTYLSLKYLPISQAATKDIGNNP